MEGIDSRHGNAAGEGEWTAAEFDGGGGEFRNHAVQSHASKVPDAFRRCRSLSRKVGNREVGEREINFGPHEAWFEVPAPLLEQEGWRKAPGW